MRFEFGFGVGFDRNGNRLDATHVNEAIKMIVVDACQRFGGCNITSGQGAWINATGDLVVEESRVLVVDSTAGQATRLHGDQVAEAKALAGFIGRVLNQEAVHFTQLVSTSENIAVVIA